MQSGIQTPILSTHNFTVTDTTITLSYIRPEIRPPVTYAAVLNITYFIGLLMEGDTSSNYAYKILPLSILHYYVLNLYFLNIN